MNENLTIRWFNVLSQTSICCWGEVSYLSEEMKLVYSTVPARWHGYHRYFKKLILVKLGEPDMQDYAGEAEMNS